MKLGTLFSGIGGPELAGEWLGWESVFHCEIESFPRRILQYYWPNAISYEDIKTTDFTIHRGQIDVLAGGFPCQPYSLAGKRKGKEDDRHLWPEMLRAIREIVPTYVVGENVYGLVNWNGGLVFEEIISDLENEGYEVQPIILPACGKDAPHKRERIWFVVYRNMPRCERDKEFEEGFKHTGRRQAFGEFNSYDGVRNATNPNISGQQNGQCLRSDVQRCNNERRNTTNNKSKIKKCSKIITNPDSIKRFERGMHKTKPKKTERHISTLNSWDDRRGWENFPTQSPLCFRDDGISSRLDGITFPKFRKESIKCAGNAIVPQVIYEIFKVIDQINSN